MSRNHMFLSFIITRHFTFSFFFFNDTATTEIYTLSLHDALPISTWSPRRLLGTSRKCGMESSWTLHRSEEHTSELQSLRHLVCRLLLEKKKIMGVSAVLTLWRYVVPE